MLLILEPREGIYTIISQLFGSQQVSGLTATTLHAEFFEQKVKCSEADLAYTQRLIWDMLEGHFANRNGHIK